MLRRAMVEFNFNPFPELQSERLVLRRIVESDLNRIFDMRSNPDVMKYIPRPLAKTMDDVYEWLGKINEGIEMNEAINWAISFKENPTEFVGLIGYFRPDKENERAEVGYILHPNFLKMGIIGESMGPVIEYGFKIMKLHSIDAVIDPANKASENVLIKAGFHKEAHFRENCLFEGKWLDSVHYCRLDHL